MTEKSPNLLSTVFSAQPTGMSRNLASISERSITDDSNSEFSRELSRATGQRQSTNASASRQDGADRSNRRSENSEPAASKLRDPSQKQTGATSDSETRKKAAASPRDSTTSNDVDTASDAKSVESDDTSSVPTDQSDDSQLEEVATTDAVAIGLGVDASKVTSSEVNGLQIDVESPAGLSTMKQNVLDTETELMPAQLHARQLQQANRSEGVQAEDVASDITLTDTLKAKPAPTAVAAQASSAALLAGVSKAQVEGQSVSSTTASQDAQELEDANSMASLTAQRRLNLSDTLSDAKLQAQQAAEQKQAMEVDQARSRQLAQQQALASVSANTTVQEAGDSTSDNMFQSVLGGTITAPVMQRTDAGSAQLATAPANIPILHSDADKAMAGNIRWMVNENVKQAVVNVTPSGMGPISVSIGIENEQMNISIVAAQGSTREALDSMLPRLREQLIAQGHDGVKVDISDGRSENSGNGYDRHAANSEQGKDAEQERTDPSASIEQTQKSENSAAELAAASDMEGFLLVDNKGQLRGGYDVYV